MLKRLEFRTMGVDLSNDGFANLEYVSVDVTSMDVGSIAVYGLSNVDGKLDFNVCVREPYIPCRHCYMRVTMWSSELTSKSL